MIVAMQNRGIGNRMMSWAQSYRLDKDIKIHWENNYYVGCNFHDLFENDIEIPSIDNIPRTQWHGSWRFVVLPSDALPYKRIDYLYSDTPRHMVDINLKLFKIFTPTKYIRDELSEWSKRFKPNTALAAIRSWPGTDRVNKIEDAYKEIDALETDDIFLTCDHYEVADKIIKRYGKRLWYRPKRRNWGDRHNEIGMQDILIDMYLGGFASTQLLSWHSTFCQFQWWFSGCKAKYKEICQFEKAQERSELYFPEHISKTGTPNDGGIVNGRQ